MYNIYRNIVHLSRRSLSTSGAVYNQNKQRVCIVGAGPAGFYAAQYMLKTLENCYVDVLEKLPVPFGLVRYGVAPDHPEVKNVINTFSKTATNPRFRFFGNVSLGKDVSLQQLRNDYHAVLLCYGADQDRRLNIPNENQPNVISARDFVAWYNGLPGTQNFQPNLKCNSVTIVGQGNVAVDVARMLLSPIDELRKTDTVEHALALLAESQLENVHLVGRRGPLNAAFTIKELREMLKLPQVKTVWRAKDFEGVAESLANAARPRKRLTELMLKSVSESHSAKQGSKTFQPIFHRAPLKVQDNEMHFGITRLENETAVLTGEQEVLRSDLVMRSIGYKSSCVDGEICFDDKSGRVHNSEGRVYKNPETQEIDHGLYVAGWLGTGPTGVIISTMNTAFNVAQAICSDISSGVIDTKNNKSGVRLNSNHRLVDWQAWERINQAEITAGKALGKPREKFVDIEQMLKVAGV